jgi:hypothetical protein
VNAAQLSRELLRMPYFPMVARDPHRVVCNRAKGLGRILMSRRLYRAGSISYLP